MLIGVISDTHGLLRPEALAALQDVDHLIHAGDVGDPTILDRLAQIAPINAIRGNIDRSGVCAQLPPTETIELAGHLLHVVHAIDELDVNPAAAGISVVIYGHSHKPSIDTREGVLFLNPGSAGPRRFSLPITVARLTLRARQAEAELVPLIVT